MKIHIVQPNEKLSMIAAQYGLDLDPLLKSNPDVDEQMILEVGQKIKVPSDGVKVVKNQRLASDSVGQNTPLPKWWYEEKAGEQGLSNSETKTAVEFGPPLQELTEYPYAYYPAIYPNAPATAPYSNAFMPSYPSYPTNTADHSNSSYDPYGVYAHIPAQPMTYSYGPAPSPWYNQAMMILASNRIPIPPRMVNVNGIRGSKLPASFFQLDDWNEDWEKEEQENKQA